MLPEFSSIYFALLGGALFAFLAGVYHVGLRPHGASIMLTMVALFFFGPQLISEYLAGQPDMLGSVSRITIRCASFIFASAVVLGIMNWYRGRLLDRL